MNCAAVLLVGAPAIRKILWPAAIGSHVPYYADRMAQFLPNLDLKYCAAKRLYTGHCEFKGCVLLSIIYSIDTY